MLNNSITIDELLNVKEVLRPIAYGITIVEKFSHTLFATNLQQTCNKILVQIAKNAYNLDFAEANLQNLLQVCKYRSKK